MLFCGQCFGLLVAKPLHRCEERRRQTPRYVSQKPPFSVFFLPVCRGAFLKVYGTSFVWFLVGKDRGPVVISMRK